MAFKRLTFEPRPYAAFDTNDKLYGTFTRLAPQ